MSWKMVNSSFCGVLMALMVACSVNDRPETPADFAVHFSNAIPDAKDRAKVQESVVKLFVSQKELLRAEQVASGITDWRKAMGLCAIAEAYILEKNASKAVELLKQAETVRNERIDWYTERIDYQLTRLYRMAGDQERGDFFRSTISPEMKSASLPEQVESLVATNGWRLAFELLKVVQENPDFEVQCSVSSGFLTFAKKALIHQEHEWCRSAVSNLLDASLKLPLEMEAAAVKEAAALLTESGERASAENVVQGFADTLTQNELPAAGRLNPLINLGLAYYAIGEADSAKATLLQALEICPQIHSTEILVPQIPVAEAFLKTGDKPSARAVYLAAVERVEHLIPRPRFIALTEICLSMANQAVGPDETLWRRIREIQANLGDPR